MFIWCARTSFQKLVSKRVPSASNVPNCNNCSQEGEVPATSIHSFINGGVRVVGGAIVNFVVVDVGDNTYAVY